MYEMMKLGNQTFRHVRDTQPHDPRRHHLCKWFTVQNSYEVNDCFREEASRHQALLAEIGGTLFSLTDHQIRQRVLHHQPNAIDFFVIFYSREMAVGVRGR